MQTPLPALTSRCRRALQHLDARCRIVCSLVRGLSPMGRGRVAARRGPVASSVGVSSELGGGSGGFVVHPPLRYHVRLAASGREWVAKGRAWVADGSRAVAAVSRVGREGSRMGRGWVAGCRGGVAVVSRLSRWCHFLSNRRRLPRNWPDGGVISGVATVITCIARHKALSRLAGAAVKQMAAHDGRDVHVSAHPAAQTPIDSGVCESFERSAW